MRYAPYSKNFQERGNVEVTSFSDYKFSHDPDKYQDSDFPSEALQGLRVKQESQRTLPIKEYLKRTFTPLTTVNHHSARSDGSSSPSSAGSPDDSERVTLTDVKTEFQDTMLANQTCEMCAGCGTTIVDRYLMKVGNGLSWHASCLFCCSCSGSMEGDMTCYVKEDQVYCKMCYSRQFGVKCSACERTIQSADWVRRAKNSVFHLACFACDDCHRQLSTGEEFAMVDHRVVCKIHYMELINPCLDGGENDSENGSNCGANGDGKNNQPKSKRVRTTFTEEQVHILQANFNLDCNPDGQDLERIARITGLTKRVTQVWFQNSRARQKKYSSGIPTNKQENTTKPGHMNEPCRDCGSVYCNCQMSPEYHKGRSLVPSSPSIPSSP